MSYRRTGSEEKCREYLTQLRWRDDVVRCPKCNSRKISRASAARVSAASTSGTRSRVPFTKSYSAFSSAPVAARSPVATVAKLARGPGPVAAAAPVGTASARRSTPSLIPARTRSAFPPTHFAVPLIPPYHGRSARVAPSLENIQATRAVESERPAANASAGPGCRPL